MAPHTSSLSNLSPLGFAPLDPMATPWTDAERWQAVQARDRRADGQFFFAVKTTGVFCRPSCRSRAPRRENVEFFFTATAASQAGYRACKRCHPHRPAEDLQGLKVVRACRLLEAEDAVPLAEVAQLVDLSVFHLHRLFKQRLGLTPAAWRRGVLAERARAALARGQSVTEAVYEAGYSSSSRFYDGVGPTLGMSPKAARAGAPGERITYTFVDTSLGRLLVAWTAKGVCHVSFDRAVAPLAARFPKAHLEPSEGGPWARQVRAVAEGTPAEVPVDLRGTAFQVRVWEALRRIPSGATRSYSSVASELALPRASRAVAGACAANSLALVVPCHRVVREGGALGGYRWGVRRKQALLRREAER